MPQHTFCREDGRHRSHGVRPRSGGACAWIKLIARLREHVVAADMIGIRPGVDDVANGFRCDPLDRGEDRRGVGRRPCVHHHDTIVAYLDADVSAGASDHEEVGPDLQHLQAVCRCGARGLRGERRDRRTTIHHEQRRRYRHGDDQRTSDSISSSGRHDVAGKRSIGLFPDLSVWYSQGWRPRRVRAAARVMAVGRDPSAGARRLRRGRVVAIG